MTLRPFLRCAVAACVLIAFAGAGADAHWTYPPTPRIPVVNSYFGTTVVDSYRWLETDAARRVDGWVAKQDALTLAYLRAQPTYPIYAKRVAQLEQRSTERFGLQIAGGHLIYLRHEPVQQQPALVSRDRIDGPERVLYDPAKHPDATGVAPAIESIFVAPDGAKVALTTQQGGAEEETLRVVDVATGKLLADTIPHAGGGTSPAAVAWDPGDTGFVHTRWPHNVPASQAHFNIALYHHALGTDPATDSYVFGHELAKTAEITLLTSVDGAQTALSVTAGDGVHASVYLRHGDGPFRQVVTPADGIGDSADARAHFVGHTLYVVTTKRRSHGEIRAIAPGGTFASSTVVVPASNVVIEDFEPVSGGFITRDIDGGDGSARYFSNGGALRARLPIPPQATIAELAGDPAGGPIVVGTMGYAHPATWYRYVPANGTLAPTGIATKPAGDFSRVVAHRVFVPSLDGRVKIPLEIVELRGTRHDGRAPTILTAYGAYGIISRPYFIGAQLAWLERGGVFAQAMIRGGGEYGEQWHRAAHLATKTKSSDDLAACARWLETHGYGTRRHLGIVGGSAGGYLMGLALTRNPEVYRAVVSFVGFYDLLRAELTPNGRFNTPEFGTVTDPTQFAWMIKQSPYRNVRPGVRYPAILMPTGANDPRVAPWQSRKMVAKLQADNASPYPIFLLQKTGQGHGIGNSLAQRTEGLAQSLTFFDSQLR